MNKYSFLYLFLLFSTLYSIKALGQSYYLQLEYQTDSLESKFIPKDSLQKYSNLSEVITSYTSIVEQLQKDGYFMLQSDNLTKTNDSVYLGKINLGQRYDSIVISAHHISKDLKQLSEIKTDTIKLSINQTQTYIQSLLSLLEKKGHPMSTVQLTNHNLIDNHVRADLDLKIDIKRKIDNIYITPYEKFPKGVKKQLLKKYKGKEFTTPTLQQLQQEIQQYPFLKIKQTPEVLFTDEQTIVYLYVDKNNASRFDGLIGFNSNEETGKLQFNGHLDLQLLNVFNAGEQLKLYWKNDGQQQSTLRIQSEVPYLFSSPFGVMGEFQIFKQDSTMQNTKLNAQALYYISLQNRMGLGIQNTSSTAGTENTYGAENFSNIFYTASHYYNIYQDHYLFPTRFRSSLQIGYGKRSTDTEELPQYFIQLYLEKLWQINNRNYFHQSIEGYYLKSDRYIYNELHRFGGNHSMRGFNENSLLAQNLLGLYNEYRYVLSSSLYAHTISDIGYYEDSLSNTQSILYSFGVGLGIKTAGGLFNLIYAAGKQPEQKFELKNAIVHISFKTQF